MVTHWPGLAYLAIMPRTFWRTLRAWPCWAWPARYVGKGVASTCRAGAAGVRIAGRALWRAGVRCGRWVWRLAVRVWRLVEPSARDAAGWLVHTAPRLALRHAARLTGRFLRWVVPAAFRAVGLAACGLWWLLGRLGRYVLAYPDYLPVVRELEAEGRARRVKAARDAWRRAFWRRSVSVGLLVLVAGLLIAGLVNRYGTRAVLALVVAAVAV